MTFSPDGAHLYVTTLSPGLSPTRPGRAVSHQHRHVDGRAELGARPRAVWRARPAVGRGRRPADLRRRRGDPGGGRPAAPRRLRVRRRRPERPARRRLHRHPDLRLGAALRPVLRCQPGWRHQLVVGLRRRLLLHARRPGTHLLDAGDLQREPHGLELRGQRHEDEDGPRDRHRPGSGRGLHRREHRRRCPCRSTSPTHSTADVVGVGLRRRRDVNATEPLAHLHHGRGLCRLAGRDQQRRHQHGSLGSRPRGDRAGHHRPPAADTYVRSDSSNSNYGTQTSIQGYRKGKTTYQPFVRFTVPSLPATPTAAKLRLYVTDSSTTTGTLYATANTSWSETSTTWNNRPATTGTRWARPRRRRSVSGSSSTSRRTSPTRGATASR